MSKATSQLINSAKAGGRGRRQGALSNIWELPATTTTTTTSSSVKKKKTAAAEAKQVIKIDDSSSQDLECVVVEPKLKRPRTTTTTLSSSSKSAVVLVTIDASDSDSDDDFVKMPSKRKHVRTSNFVVSDDSSDVQPVAEPVKMGHKRSAEEICLPSSPPLFRHGSPTVERHNSQSSSTMAGSLPSSSFVTA
ncbi:hypothetical protein GGI21_004984, partial [Coemansia aciculifera]